MRKKPRTGNARNPQTSDAGSAAGNVRTGAQPPPSIDKPPGPLRPPRGGKSPAARTPSVGYVSGAAAADMMPVTDEEEEGERVVEPGRKGDEVCAEPITT